MKKLRQNKKMWIVTTFVMFFLLFAGIGLYQHWDTSRAADYEIRDSEGNAITGTYDLRRATDTLSIYGADATDTFQWTSANEEILTLDPATITSSSVRINAVINGSSTVNVKITHADGTTEDIPVQVQVVFSINEYLNATDNSVAITKVNENDTRKSIVMDYGSSLYFGTNAKTETNKLNLIFGDATKANWSSSNSDVVAVNSSSTAPLIKANGAGRARLSVSYMDGVTEYTDTITVYVRPQVTFKGQSVNSSSIIMENGDTLGVSAMFAANPTEAISNKLVWVIAKDSGEDTVLVRDSLGNKGSDGDNAKLVFNSSLCTYRLDAKAGVYKILFYVVGTYTNFAAVQEYTPGCNPVAVNVTVNSNFTDKDAIINIGGRFNLADALNISSEVLNRNFTVSNLVNTGSHIQWNPATKVATGVSSGEASFIVTANNPLTDDIPGIENVSIKVNIKVSDTFGMNLADTVMAVGDTLDLSGSIGSGSFAEASAFTWTSSDTTQTYLTLTADGQYATVKANKATLTNQPVKITLAWDNGEGVTLVTGCEITIIASATNIDLNPKQVEMEVGDTQVITTGLSGIQNFAWFSSDESIVKVQAQTGNISAVLTAGKNVGTAIVTVVNKDNNVSATCRVIVSAPITKISIDKGDSYTTTLSEGYVYLKALYEPSNATSTDVVWSSSNRSVASIDSNGTVTLTSIGMTTITVSPKYNPNGAFATCVINIVENPITTITTDVSTLDMIAGDSYTVTTTIDPPDATDPTLTWISNDTSIAKVEGGIITAVAPGSTYIMVSGGIAQTTVITVNVRARLTSIAFEQQEYELKVGDTQNIPVIFTPSEYVNTELTWISSNTAVFTVDTEGNITGVSTGYAMLSVVSEDLGIQNTISCTIHVIDADVAGTDYSLSPAEGTVYIGSTLQIEAVFEPATTTDQELSWTSSNPEVATISDTGLVTGVAAGSVTITSVYTHTPDGKAWVRQCTVKVTKAPVAATGIAVNPTSQEVHIGESFTIGVTFTPADTTDQTVTFNSTDEKIATVNPGGTVTGVTSGSAIIICRSNDGGYVATCKVEVTQGVTLTLNPSTRDIAVGKSFTIKKTVLPSGASKVSTWKTSNSKVATVTDSGKVKGIKKGSATITCTLTETLATATCKVKVSKLNSSIKLNKTKIRIGKGQTYKLKATVWTNNSTTPKVKWRSKNKRIATVGSAGKIRAKKVGITKITATTKDSIKAKARCSVQVIQRATSVKIVPDYAVCYVGGTKKLTAKVSPGNASIKNVAWKSSDTSIARVTGGVVRGLQAGSVTITATAKDGSNKKGRCTLEVMEKIPSTSVVVAQSELTMKRGDTTKLSYTVLPNNTSDNAKLASDNNRVAKITSSGQVKGVGTGTANITILMDSGISTTVAVHVVALDRSSVNMRQYDTTTLLVLGTTDNVTWYATNERVATVANGVVTGRGKGSTYVYAYVNGCKLACLVTITSIK